MTNILHRKVDVYLTYEAYSIFISLNVHLCRLSPYVWTEIVQEHFVAKLCEGWNLKTP